MVKHIWSVLCERISQDQASNLISYLTCIEALVVPGLPVLVQNLALGSRWNRDGDTEETLKFRLLLQLPDQTEQVLISAQATIKEANHRTNFVLNGVIFAQAGEHCFILQTQKDSNWVTVSEVPFYIKVDAKTLSEEPHKEQTRTAEAVAVAEKASKKYRAEPLRKIHIDRKKRAKPKRSV